MLALYSLRFSMIIANIISRTNAVFTDTSDQRINVLAGVDSDS